MFLQSLDRKPLFVDNNGNTIRDLTQSIFDFRSNNYVSFNMFRISYSYLMRPDLISQAVYNNTLYTEYVLKYNGVSNPFSMEEGDLILIPSLDSAKKNTKNTSGSVIDGSDVDPSQRLRNSYKYIDPTKVPKRDGDIINFEDRNLSPNKNKIQEGVLPPNISEIGTSQIIERNGRIYFGENIGESACLKSGMSSSEFLNKVIKSKQS